MTGVVGRALVAGVVLAALSACGITVTSDRDRPAEPIDATAHSTVDGVETWDLTGEPSAEAFGFEGDSSAAIYETSGKPRRVRIVLPGRTVETEVELLSFYRGGTGDYSFGVRSPHLAVDALTATFRDVLGQLDLDESLADQFAQEVAAAPPDGPEAVEVGVGHDGATRQGAWTVGPAVTFTPMADGGSLTFSGSTDAS